MNYGGNGQPNNLPQMQGNGPPGNNGNNGGGNNGGDNRDDSDNKEDAPKPKTKNEKIKLLLAMKAIELTKKLEKEVSLEQNMIMQRQLLALISYVPGFDYNEKKNKGKSTTLQH